jgi:hypothetical protein
MTYLNEVPKKTKDFLEHNYFTLGILNGFLEA